jgi:hypothetical protein
MQIVVPFSVNLGMLQTVGVGWQKLQPAVSIGNAACHLIENVETFEYAA